MQLYMIQAWGAHWTGTPPSQHLFVDEQEVLVQRDECRGGDETPENIRVAAGGADVYPSWLSSSAREFDSLPPFPA